jgi:hypothetical protein
MFALLTEARKGYRFGVYWVAMNDEPSDMDVHNISGYISTLLLADLFDKDPDKVAADILKVRKKNSTEESMSLNEKDEKKGEEKKGEEKKGEEKTTVTGWVADLLKSQGEKGEKGGKAVPKIKPTKNHPTKSDATRAFLAGLFRSMKAQGKDVGAMKGGKKESENVRANAALLADQMITQVVEGNDALDTFTQVVEMSPKKLRAHLSKMKKSGKL